MYNIEKVKVGSDFSGVGAFNQALIRLGINYEEVFACDLDKYARKTFIHNYGEPKYYPENVYDREIPTEPLDIYMTSPPCQSFSLAGKRKGEDDDRGVLFYNSHEFIKKNNPRYFIFENVKGLISDENGKTFQRWIDFLGGKSVNGTLTMFPHEESVPYHVYYKVLNAKDYGVPQNRERIFIIGIRDDADNDFTFPKPFPLIKRLKDVLEENVYDKYYLSYKQIISFTKDSDKQTEKGNGFKFEPRNVNDITYSKSITTKAGSRKADEFIYETPKVKFQLTGGKWDKTHEQSGRVYDENGISPTIHTMGGGNQEPKVAIGGIDNTSELLKDCRIRKLTPRECFRLMDFPDTFDFSVVSDSQAYKQAGNSIVVNVLAQIISKLKQTKTL